MTSHADRYGLLAPVSFTIALFSADGQIGSSILNTLGSSKRKAFQVVAFIPPGAVSYISHPIPTKKKIKNSGNPTHSWPKPRGRYRRGIHTQWRSYPRSPCHHPSRRCRRKSAALPPSSYGMHASHLPSTQRSNEVHPPSIKSESTLPTPLNTSLPHTLAPGLTSAPSILAGEMGFTPIGCGDLYNQAREKVWRPWGVCCRWGSSIRSGARRGWGVL